MSRDEIFVVQLCAYEIIYVLVKMIAIEIGFLAFTFEKHVVLMVITIKLERRKIPEHRENGRVRFHYSDIVSIPEWPKGPLVELMDGDLFMVPSPDIKHQRISMRIESYLKDFLNQYPVAEMFHAPVDVILSDEDVVIPDIFIILSANSDIIGEKNVQGTPDLMIEIISTDAKKDLTLKKQIYEHYKVKEYWIVDPKKETVTIYLMNSQSGHFDPLITYSGNDIISSSLLPEFKITAGEFFAI